MRPFCACGLAWGGEEPLTLAEVGDRLGLTRERIRQIERKAMKKLYEKITESDAL